MTTSTFGINSLFSSFGEEHSIWREFTLEMSSPFVFASFAFLMMSSWCFSPPHLPISVFTKNQLTYFKFSHLFFSSLISFQLLLNRRNVFFPPSVDQGLLLCWFLFLFCKWIYCLGNSVGVWMRSLLIHSDPSFEGQFTSSVVCIVFNFYLSILM